MQNPKILKVALLADVIKRGKQTIWDTKNAYYQVGLKVSEYICQSLGCVLEIALAPDGQFGMLLENGSWTGMVGMVNRGEADMAVSEIAITESRSRGVDFTYPYAVADVSFITQKPTYSPDLTTLFNPFSWEVWCCLAVFHIVMPLVFYARFRRKHSFSKILVYTFGTVLGQKVFKNVQKTSERLLVLLWMVVMMIMGIVYKAQLLSILTFPTLTGVRHISELSVEIELGKYDSSAYPGSYYAHAMSQSSDRSLRVIAANLRKNDETPDIEHYLQKAGTVRTAFISAKGDFLSLKNKYYISDDVIFNELQAIAITKDFCCKEKIDWIIHKMSAGGLYGKFVKEENFKKMMKNISHFFPTEEKAVTSISLLHLYSVFLLIFIGHILAFLSLAAELIIYKYDNIDTITEIFKRKERESNVF